MLMKKISYFALAVALMFSFSSKIVLADNTTNMDIQSNSDLSNSLSVYCDINAKSSNQFYLMISNNTTSDNDVVEEGIVAFSWNNITAAKYYKFKLKNVSNNGNWSSPLTLTKTKIRVYGTGITPGETYQCWIGAYDINNKLISSGTATQKAIRAPYIVSSYEIEQFLNTTKKTLSDVQKKVIRTKINEYQTNPIIKANYIDKATADPLLMFFEGATDDIEEYCEGEKFPYHTSGRYQAMAVVIKNKKIVNVFTNTSTMPDYPHNKNMATVKEGVYPFVSGYHSYGKSWGHIALRVNNGTTTPATFGSEKKDGTESGINIHMGWNSGKDGKTMSEGCLLVHKYTEYNEFAKDVGYRKTGTTIEQGKFGEYNAVSGYVLIDRSLRPW